MGGWQDEVRNDYAEMRAGFASASVKDFESGEWFAKLVQWMLENYAKEVDANYLKRKYPGVAPANQAKKAITIAAKYNGVAGGAAAAGITALEVSSFGPQAMITVPAIGAAIMGDIAYSTRTQLRTTYDLSVIHGAPLAIDDVEDCYMIFMNAVGVKMHELAGGVGKAVGPKLVAYNVRRLLRSGVRKVLQAALMKVGGSQLAKKLTERAMMRLLVPGISIPIAYGFNYYFTKGMLNVADSQMRRRGKVVQPVLRMFRRRPELERTFPLKAFITVIDAGDREGWSEGQMDALRHLQSALVLRDEELAALDSYFDRDVASLLEEFKGIEAEAFEDLVELLLAGAALYPTEDFDDAYATSIAKLSERGTASMDEETALKQLRKRRKELL